MFLVEKVLWFTKVMWYEDVIMMKTTQCSVCNEDFPSRNKLFKHLEESGHGISASTVVGDQNNIKNEEVDNNANNKRN